MYCCYFSTTLPKWKRSRDNRIWLHTFSYQDQRNRYLPTTRSITTIVPQTLVLYANPHLRQPKFNFRNSWLQRKNLNSNSLIQFSRCRCFVNATNLEDVKRDLCSCNPRDKIPSLLIYGEQLFHHGPILLSDETKDFIKKFMAGMLKNITTSSNRHEHLLLICCYRFTWK